MFFIRPFTLLASYILLLFLVGSASSFAQETSASLATSIEGVMRDSSGSPVANATVNLSSNVSPAQTATTNSDGTYTFHGLRAGTYKVSAALAGFNDFHAQEFVIKAGQGVHLDIALQIAGTTTSVDVTGDVAHVETEDPSVSDTLSAKEVTGYQLNGRNFIQLIALAPGVSNQTGTDEARVGVQGSAAYSVNGGRTEYNSFDLDGTDLLNVGFNGSVNTLIAYPSLDAIGEMKILTSNYGAMYGRTASGTVLVNTKSGTTDFHGDLYYFNRNEAFNARNFFDQTKGAPLYRRHDLGGTLGGPVYIPGVYNKTKDKTFFFFSEEYRNEKTPYQFNQGVPSAAERTGNFSDVCPSASQLLPDDRFLAQPIAGVSALAYPDCPTPIGAPSPVKINGILYPNAQAFQPYPGNQVPLDPNAALILKSGIIPLPNSASGCNSTIHSCYNTTTAEPTHWRQELFRLDHYINETNHLMFRYIHDSWSTVTSTPQYGIVTNNVPTIQNSFIGPGLGLVARYSQTLSPTWLNEAFVSYANSDITLTDRNAPGVQAQRPAALDAPCLSTGSNNGNPDTTGCGIGYLFNNKGGGKLPGLVLQGGGAYGGGFGVDAGYMPWTHKNPVYTFGDAMTKQLGKHFLQFGSEFIFYYRKQTNSVSGSATGDTQGLLTFNSRPSGNSFAALLEGAYTSFEQDSTQRTYRQRYQIAEPYLQDDWKITPRLTVNLGLRLSLFGRYRELDNNVYNWVPSAFNPVLARQIGISSTFGSLVRPAVGANGQATLIGFFPEQPDVHQLNGLVRCGYNGVPASCMSSHLVNPAPRIGFAWDPFGNGKTSIRGGYGIFFEHGTGNESNTGTLEGSAPLVLSMSSSPIFNVLSCIGGAHLAQCAGPTDLAPGQLLAYPLNVTSIPTKAVWPYVQQWSFSVQREVVSHLIANVAYVGSKGTHLTAESQINAYGEVSPADNPFGAHEPITSSACTGATFGNNNTPGYVLPSGAAVLQGGPAYNNMAIACSNLFPTTASRYVNDLRPYKGIGQIAQLSNVANSAYNAFQATLRRTSGPLTLGVSYTYSHSLDNSSDRFDPVPNGYDLGSNRASSNFDQRHLLNVSYIYELPTPKSWQSSRLLRNGLGGWQWSGITVFQSGIPFSVINSPTGGLSVADNAGVANGIGTVSIQSYPDLVGNVHGKPSTAGDSTTFGPLLDNPGAFVAPRGLTLGNARRNSLRNPNRTNFDMSLFKNFKTSEKSLIEFRAEAFNIFNTTQFEIYNPAKRNQPNNTITCYGGAETNYSAGADQCLPGNSFLRPVDAHRPRTMQLALKFIF